MNTNHERRIVLIRHGQTDWNLESRVQGYADVPLNAEGMRQAEMLGVYVREHIHIDRVISSDLRRCTQTADALGMPYELDPRLREFDFGDLAGKKWDEIMTEHSEVAAEIRDSISWARRPGGESSIDVAARAAGFVHESGILKQDSTWALVSHGGFIKRLICVLLDMPMSYHSKFDIDNTSITVLKQPVAESGAELALETLNFTGHLVR